jgi:hypothetical protein
MDYAGFVGVLNSWRLRAWARHGAKRKPPTRWTHIREIGSHRQSRHAMIPDKGPQPLHTGLAHLALRQLKTTLTSTDNSPRSELIIRRE